MSIMELNKKPVAELETMHDRDGFHFLICDGKILWYWEDDEGL